MPRIHSEHQRSWFNNTRIAPILRNWRYNNYATTMRQTADTCPLEFGPNEDVAHRVEAVGNLLR
jgi:hypothetical protein